MEYDKTNCEERGTCHRICQLPQYIVLSCMLGFLAVAVFLRYVQKSVFVFLDVSLYGLQNECVSSNFLLEKMINHKIHICDLCGFRELCVCFEVA